MKQYLHGLDIVFEGNIRFKVKCSIIVNEHIIQLFAVEKETMMEGGKMLNTQQVLSWVSHYEKLSELKVEKIHFSESKEWAFSENKCAFVHKTNGFFSIKGLRFQSNFFGNNVFDQPIIHQPEIGILGFLAKIEGGALYLLAQAKTEPGNVNMVQLGPTLQATESNYSALHGGTIPMYLSYFLNADRFTVMVDQLQSEQGTRFLKKRNRNMVVLLPPSWKLEESQSHRWISWYTWQELMRVDHMVNTDSRSVIASLIFSNAPQFFNRYSTNDLSKEFEHSLETETIGQEGSSSVFLWLKELSNYYTLKTDVIPLSQLKGWKITDEEIIHESGGFFSVHQYRVQCLSREVHLWDQPLICTHEKGFLGLALKRINGILHLLLQARVEPGHFNKIELTSTVHISLGEQEEKGNSTLFKTLMDKGVLLTEGSDSEEGGRFYKDENEYKIVLLDDAEDFELPANYKWITLNQVRSLILLNNFLTNELRSLLALMSTKF